MKVFVLGGYGKTGLPAVKLLAQGDLVSQIAIAGRNLERAESAAAQVGKKAVAVKVDGVDDEALASLSAGYDLIMNAAYNTTVLPGIRAAIRTGIHYCDVSWGDALNPALHLAPEAEAAGITAIIATGISPCISNLMGVHAARQLDQVEQLQTGRADVFDFGTGLELTPQQWQESPEESLNALLEFKPFFTWALQEQQQRGLTPILGYQDGGWVESDPIRSGLDVPHLESSTIFSYPYACTDDEAFQTLPIDLARSAPVWVWFSPLTPQLHEILREQVLQMLAGNIDAETALNTFYDTAESDPQYWLTIPDDAVLIPKMWVRAAGYKGGRAARHTCWFTGHMWNIGGYFMTSVALAAAGRIILRGEIQKPGVITAEKVFEPQAFFKEVASLLPEPPPDGRMIDESFEWLE